MFRSITYRILSLFAGFCVVGEVHAWYNDHAVYKHGMRFGSPLSLLPRVYGYGSKTEWPAEVKQGCDITKKDRHYSTNHHPDTHDRDFDPVTQFKWTKMQYLVTARVDTSPSWNPYNFSIYFVFLITMSEYNVVAAVFNLQHNEVKIEFLEESKLDADEWNQAYHFAYFQHGKQTIGKAYPPSELPEYNVTFGVLVVIDHDATYEAVYACYRDTAKFKRSPYNTFCEKFYEKKKFVRYRAPASTNITYVFLPGIDWDQCKDPYCETAHDYSDNEAMIGCTLYNRSSYEWLCTNPPCKGLKYDRPFETAQKIALSFRTSEDKKPFKE